jgi:hypothetical protein
MEPKQQINLRLPVSLIDAIKHRASEERITVTELVRRLLSQEMTQTPNVPVLERVQGIEDRTRSLESIRTGMTEHLALLAEDVTTFKISLRALHLQQEEQRGWAEEQIATTSAQLMTYLEQTCDRLMGMMADRLGPLEEETPKLSERLTGVESYLVRQHNDATIQILLQTMDKRLKALETQTPS